MNQTNTFPAHPLRHTRRTFEKLVLRLGVAHVKATKQYYVERGLSVEKSFGGKYVEFATPESPVGLAVYTRRFAAKDA